LNTKTTFILLRQPAGSVNLRPTSTFFVQAGGEVGSLDALDICCGDILVVDRAVLPHDGQVALVFRDGELALDVWGSGTSCELWGTVVAFARRLS